MASVTNGRGLPAELMFLIFESLTGPNPRAIFPASHEVTRTLLSLTRVCKALYPFAVELLRRHCVYIDSRDRASAFLLYMSSPPAFLDGHVIKGIENLFIEPFPWEYDDDDPEADGLARNGSGELRPSTEADLISCLIGLNNLTIATITRDILLGVAPTLKRIIVDIQFRSLPIEEDTKGVLPMLKEGFEALAHLEECISISDEMYLDFKPYGAEKPIWDAHWPRLRRLAIYHPWEFSTVDAWCSIARLPDIETVVVFGSHGMRSSLRGNTVDVKRKWIHAVAKVTGQSKEEVQQDIRPLTFVHLDEVSVPVDLSLLVPKWREIDPKNRIQVRQASIRLVLGRTNLGTWDLADYPFPLHMSIISPCMRKVTDLALQGRLWATARRDSRDACC